jgi:hypothetical protein
MDFGILGKHLINIMASKRTWSPVTVALFALGKFLRGKKWNKNK